MSEQGPQQVKEHVQSPQDPDVEVDGRPANGNNTDTVDGHRHQEGDESEPFMFKAVVRTGPIPRGGTDGSLLRALPDGSVDFTGTNPDDPTTVFHVEKSEEFQANALRYIGPNDDNYYLRIDEDGRVKLVKSEQFPTEEKYFFSIQSIGRESNSPVTIKSLKTGEYLHCNKDGVVFMKKAITCGNEQPKDRQTWIREEGEQVFQYKTFMVTFIAITEFERKDESSEHAGKRKSEVAGLGYPGNPKKAKLEDPTEGNSEYPETGYSEDVG